MSGLFVHFSPLLKTRIRDCRKEDEWLCLHGMQQQVKVVTESWKMVIGPPKGWCDLHLRDLWRYRNLVGLFVRRDFMSGGAVSPIRENFLDGGALG